MTKLAQRFIERAVLEADQSGHFDPSKLIRRLNVNEFQLNEIARELVDRDVLDAPYSSDGNHRWQLLGDAQKLAKAAAKLKLQATGPKQPAVALKPAKKKVASAK